MTASVPLCSSSAIARARYCGRQASSSSRNATNSARLAAAPALREPEAPDYDPEGMGFAIRDPEQNIWSFGSYGLGEG